MKFSVTVIETERGWGQKVDEVREFDSADEAWKFYDEVNKNLGKNKDVPELYWYAEDPQRVK